MDRIVRPQSMVWNEERSVGRVVITTAPCRARALPIAACAVVWNGVLVYGVATAGPAALVVCGVHLAFGLLLAYQAVFRLCAVTRITLAGDGLVVEHVGAPGPRTRVPIEDVDALDVEQVSVAWHAVARFGSNQKTPWMLRVLLHHGGVEPVVVPDLDAEHLGFMAARVNELLREMRVPLGYRDERMLPPAA